MWDLSALEDSRADQRTDECAEVFPGVDENGDVHIHGSPESEKVLGIPEGMIPGQSPDDEPIGITQGNMQSGQDGE